MWWRWLIFGLILVLIPVGILNLYLWGTKKNKPTEEQKKHASVNIVKFITFYWLCDFFYMVSFNNWRVAQYILGLVIIAIMFLNLSRTVISDKKKDSFSKYGMLLDFVVGVTISVYLLYLVPNDNGLRDVLIPIISAIYGGLITLVGVAWTIRWSNESNQKQRKEQVKPLFYGGAFSGNEKMTPVQFQKDNIKEHTISFGCFRNTDKVAFTIVSLTLEGNTYPCEINSVIDKSELFFVSVKTKDKLEKCPEFIMNIKTIDGDMVSYKVTVNTEIGYVSNVEEVVE